MFGSWLKGCTSLSIWIYVCSLVDNAHCGQMFADSFMINWFLHTDSIIAVFTTAIVFIVTFVAAIGSYLSFICILIHLHNNQHVIVHKYDHSFIVRSVLKSS